MRDLQIYLQSNHTTVLKQRGSRQKGWAATLRTRTRAPQPRRPRPPGSRGGGAAWSCHVTRTPAGPGMEPEEGTPLWRLQKLPAERGPQVRGQARPPESRSRAGLAAQGREGQGRDFGWPAPCSSGEAVEAETWGATSSPWPGVAPRGFVRRLRRAGRTLTLVVGGEALCSLGRPVAPGVARCSLGWPGTQ